ncbi:MAG: MBL fold metallo-hydrolase [Betaproteobacteria bacterium]|jgi:L-ascorbate metabolism protein UlaG (beta-lactamase superfamily)|nr:MBL fold metallo-hydrolase [Rhodocyclaceae bacterium]MCA3134607.1 MBL fold metallo-hydrolase [Rhodocyclaceae bacterium]MCA3143072.1 MBL fold metallo-hydrolase [Rhodocyclaceae bacterium]MCA3144569.1 MBL fold metallo-hydrolase [Rhodocyclaceae bacterium]MCE2898175.1 MBL fold metallo-hydrolase [Betaproteobacteria bacterium]
MGHSDKGRGAAVAALLVVASGLAGLALGQAGDAAPAAPAVHRNTYGSGVEPARRLPVGYMLRRAWLQLTGTAPAAEPAPRVGLDLDAMAREPFAVAWLGHATLLVRAGGLWMLMDPVLSPYVAPVQGFGPARREALPLAPEALPHIDVVLVSHNHYDHLDRLTVRALALQKGGPPLFLAGAGSAAWFARETGMPGRDLQWWEQVQFGATAVRFVPALHFSGRGLADRNRMLWGGWVVEHEGRRLYFAGDTGWSEALFDDVRAQVGPVHLAALPIAPVQPAEIMGRDHLSPAEAVQAHLRLRACTGLAVHWGTFQLGDEPLDGPPRLAREAASAAGATGFRVPALGEVVRVDAETCPREEALS